MATQKPREVDYFISQARAAELLGVTPMTIWRWMRDGKLQAVIVGGHRMVPRTEVDRLKREMIEAAE